MCCPCEEFLVVRTWNNKVRPAQGFFQRKLGTINKDTQLEIHFLQDFQQCPLSRFWTTAHNFTGNSFLLASTKGNQTGHWKENLALLLPFSTRLIFGLSTLFAIRCISLVFCHIFSSKWRWECTFHQNMLAGMSKQTSVHCVLKWTSFSLICNSRKKQNWGCGERNNVQEWCISEQHRNLEVLIPFSEKSDLVMGFAIHVKGLLSGKSETLSMRLDQGYCQWQPGTLNEETQLKTHCLQVFDNFKYVCLWISGPFFTRNPCQISWWPQEKEWNLRLEYLSLTLLLPFSTRLIQWQSALSAKRETCIKSYLSIQIEVKMHISGSIMFCEPIFHLKPFQHTSLVWVLLTYMYFHFTQTQYPRFCQPHRNISSFQTAGDGFCKAGQWFHKCTWSRIEWLFCAPNSNMKVFQSVSWRIKKQYCSLYFADCSTGFT